MKQSPRHTIITGTILFVCLPLSLFADGSPIEETPVERANTLSNHASKLSKQYLQPALLETKYRFESKFNNAKVAYQLEDYGRASLIFLDIVNAPGARQFEGYRETLFLLGESLFKQRNLLAARQYYSRLVEMGRGRHFKASVVRLLKIASRTQNYKGLQKLYDQANISKDLGPPAQYMQAKVQYQRGDYQLARRNFLKAANAENYRFVATYYAAVSFVAEKEYESAQKLFRRVLTYSTPENPRIKEVRYLTYMALGRLYYEQKEYTVAVDFYQRVPRSSEHFDRALYELIWVLVEQQNLEAATRVADVFFYLSDPDPTHVPQVELLRADLMLRQGEYDKAKAAYNKIVDSFKPLDQQLQQLTRRHSDLRAYFRKLLEKGLEQAEPRMMPESVQKWVQQSPSMERAKQSLTELKDLANQIESSRQTLAKIDARLDAGTRIQSFPTIAAGKKRALDLRSAVLRDSRQVLQNLYKQLKPKLSASQKRTFSELESQNRAILRKLSRLPATSSDIEKREKQLDKTFSKLSKRLANLQYSLRAQRAELDAVDAFMETDQGANLAPGKKQKVERLRGEIQNRIDKLETKRQRLKSFIERRRLQFGLGDQLSKLAEGGFERLSRLIDRQWQLLASAANATSRTQTTRWIRAYETLQETRETIRQFESRIESFTDERVRELKQTVRNQRQNLDAMESRVEDTLAQARETTAKIAEYDFLRVKAQFEQIVQRGQLGTVDVVWKKKEDISDRIQQVIDERSDKIQRLEDSFEEIE
jgi:CHASE3 domain sensor protein